MNKQDIEDEAIKYCSHIDFSNDKSLNEKGRIKVAEWCKQDFIAGAEWMQEQLYLSVVMQRSEQLISLLKKLKDENMCSYTGDELIEALLKEINCA